jgi:hypothetical protein
VLHCATDLHRHVGEVVVGELFVRSEACKATDLSSILSILGEGRSLRGDEWHATRDNVGGGLGYRNVRARRVATRTRDAANRCTNAKGSRERATASTARDV